MKNTLLHNVQCYFNIGKDFLKFQNKEINHKFKKSFIINKMISRSIVVCFRDSFSHFFKQNFIRLIFPAFHFNFSNQGVGLLTFKIKESERKLRRAK